MYFWKIDSLKRDLKAGTMSNVQVYPYILVFVGLYSLAFPIAELFPEEHIDAWVVLSWILDIVVPIVGIMFCYRANGGRNGTRFADKYFSLGFVLSIRFAAYFLPIFCIGGIFWEVTRPEHDIFGENFIWSYLSAIWLILYYWRLIDHIREVAEA